MVGPTPSAHHLKIFVIDDQSSACDCQCGEAHFSEGNRGVQYDCGCCNAPVAGSGSYGREILAESTEHVPGNPLAAMRFEFRYDQ
jgi:hypothetical protein